MSEVPLHDVSCGVGWEADFLRRGGVFLGLDVQRLLGPVWHWRGHHVRVRCSGKDTVRPPDNTTTRLL